LTPTRGFPTARRFLRRIGAVGIILMLPVAALSGQASGADSSPGGVGALAVEEQDWTARGAGHRRYELVLPEAPAQGDVYTVGVRIPGTGRVQGELVLSDGTTLSAHGWRVGVGRDQLWTLLFGVPSTAPPGEARLKVAVHPFEAASSGGIVGGTHILEGTTSVRRRSFVSERIALNSAMTSLRAEPDPRKDEESRILWELLHTTDLGARYHTGAFIMPVDSFRYTSNYGDRRTYAYSDGNTAGAIHNGVDMAAPTGTPVAAAGRGRVVMAVDRIVTGGTVVIEHLPAVYSLYYHLHTLEVVPGEVVERGEIIGTVGSTGLSTGPHLHWELRVSGSAVDPERRIDRPYLDINSIRRALLTAH
jgi:hypothetical protein